MTEADSHSDRSRTGRPATDRIPAASERAEAYLTQSAIRLARICRKHFAIEGGADRLRVGGEIGAANVSAFLTEYTAAVRPQGLSTEKALPARAPDTLRTLLWTRPVADAVLNDVVRLSLYSDQILIADPFSEFVSSRRFEPGPEGPHARPELWVQQFANWALMICALEPWFSSRLALLIPDPDGFGPEHPSFEQLALEAMERGLLPNKPTPEVMEDMLEAIAFTSRSNEELRDILELVLPELPANEREAVASALDDYRIAHPMRHTPLDPKYASLIVHGNGYNVFKATWTADQIGGYIVPRGAHDRMVFRRLSRGSAGVDSTDALATAFAAADLPMLNNVSLSTALDLRRSGRLAAFRTFLHDTWKAASDPDAEIKGVDRERQLVDQLKTQHRDARDEWMAIYKDLGVKGGTALFAAPLAQVIEGGLVPAIAGATSWLYSGWSAAARNFRRRPAALLVQLEQETHPSPLRRVLASIERRL